MSSEDHQNEEVSREEYVEEGHSFDELAKGIANGALSRGQLLKLAGAAVLGSVLGGALPGVAVAKKKKKKHHHGTPPAPILSPPPTCIPGNAVCGTGAAAACCPTDPSAACGCFPEVGGQSSCEVASANAACTPCTFPKDCPVGSTCTNSGSGQTFCTCTSNSDCPSGTVCGPSASTHFCFPLCVNGVPSTCP